MSSYFQESGATLFIMVTWECKICISESPSSHYCWARHQIVWAVPWVSWDWLSQLCSLLLVLPQPPHYEGGEEHQRPGLCASTEQQWVKHQCLFNAIFMADSKQHHEPLGRKLPLTSGKTITPAHYMMMFTSKDGAQIVH